MPCVLGAVGGEAIITGRTPPCPGCPGHGLAQEQIWGSFQIGAGAGRGTWEEGLGEPATGLFTG